MGEGHEQVTTTSDASTPSMPPMSAAAGKLRNATGARSRFGCDTCRARKVKCDERPGLCANCERLGLPCHGRKASNASEDQQQQRQHASPPSETSSGTKRKRTFESCVSCRGSRTRCSGDRPACLRCQHRETECVYEAGAVPAWAQRINSSNISAARSVDVSSSDATFARTGSKSTILPAAQKVQSSTASSNSNQNEDDRSYTSNSNSLSWLTSSALPSDRRLRILVEAYFNNIHGLRCLGFIHKPSFLHKLDHELGSNLHDNALLYIVCAFGAQFYALGRADQTSASFAKFVISAGSAWANKTQTLILSNLGVISVENLMAAVLLHEYRLRLGEFATAFMLSGIMARMAQATQINLEYSTDVLCQETDDTAPSSTAKESRRRLMWSCYISDTFVGSGVDQLTLVDEKDIKIQLPCNESKFRNQMPCITPTLDFGILSFLGGVSACTQPEENIGMAAYFIRHMSTRKKILRYIKRLDTAKKPWLPDSEFAIFDAECRAWYNGLPQSMQFNKSVIYIRKETQQISALVMLHSMYHQTLCDLFRICTPHLYQLRNPFEFPPEQLGFLQSLQTTLFEHAKSLANILAEALKHGPSNLCDSWLPSIAYDSCRIMLYYLTQIIDPSLESNTPVILQTIPLIQSDIKVLKAMRPLHAIAGPLSVVAETMLGKARAGSRLIRQNVVPDDPYSDVPDDDERITRTGPPPQSAPDYVLNPLSIFRLARKSVPEKHAPERRPPSSSQSQSQSHPSSTVGHQSPVAFFHHYSPPGNMPFENHHLPTDFDDLQFLLTSDLGWTWQPQETATGSGVQGSGVPPWMSNFQGVNEMAFVGAGGGNEVAISGMGIGAARQGLNLDYWYLDDQGNTHG